ncbi:MAG TPA: glycosyltransferase [Candidatus Saccharimonadales bacterium]|nr:glycosyltransferase [Candidatus Saccharimonadales bacterium]
MRKITVTVGIPTLNEAANIANLLNTLINQTSSLGIIEKIHIVDDNSTDQTLQEIQSITDKRIYVQVRKKRQGQNSAQNIIFENATTDTVLILEADTKPTKKTYIDNMVKPLIKNPSIGYIQGGMIPLPAKTFLGSVLNKHFAIFTKFIIENKTSPLPITSGRGGRLFTKAVYTKLRWPSEVPDDDYAALWCLSHNFLRSFSRNAHCYYQRPQSLDDYIKEKQKIHNAEPSIRKHFSNKVIGKHFQFPQSIRLAMMFCFLFYYPLEFCVYLGIVFIEKCIIKKGIYTDFWPQTKTTRKLEASKKPKEH